MIGDLRESAEGRIEALEREVGRLRLELVKSNNERDLAEAQIDDANRWKLQADINAERSSELLYMRRSVRAFARAMETTLRENDWKGEWVGCDVRWLYRRIFDEMRELDDAINGSSDGSEAMMMNIEHECCDVANFAMMIADITKGG